jgi:cytochrome P450
MTTMRRTPTTERSSRDWFRFDVVTEDDYHLELAERRRRDPVQYLAPRPHGRPVGMYAVYRHDDVARVLRDQSVFTLDVVRDRYGAVLGRRTMISLDSDERRPYRRLLAGMLGPGRGPELTARAVLPALDEVLDDLAEGQVVDLTAAVSGRLPVLALARMMGLPSDVTTSLGELSTAIAGFMDRPIPAVRAARALRGLLAEPMANRRRRPRSDLISEVVNAEIDGERLTDAEALSLLTLLVWAGTETTGPALSNILYALLVHPDQRSRLRADPGLLPGAIEEGLRWESPMQWTCRTVAAETRVGRTQIPAGSLALAHIGSANRDEACYVDPGRFDLARSPADHFAFGYGPHHCVGSHLGRAELSVAVSALLDRFPEMALAGELPVMTGQVVRTPSHLRVRLGSRHR